MAEVTIEAVVKKYVALRNKKSEVEASIADELASIKMQMSKLEAWIQLQAEELGVSSFKTPAGTAFISSVDSATVADWDVVLTYIRDNDAYDLLERRVNKTAVKAIIDESSEVPPGINYAVRRTVNVRKPSVGADL